MNQQAERLEIPNWLRSFIGAFWGGTVGGVFIYTYLGNVALSLLGFTVGCLTAYILPRPVIFGQKMKEAWKKARGISLKRRRRVEMAILFSTLFFWLISILMWIPLLFFLFGSDGAEKFGTLCAITGGVFWFLITIGEFCCPSSRGIYRDLKKGAKRFNFFTAPFWVFWLVWRVTVFTASIVITLPVHGRVIARRIATVAPPLGKFFYRFAYHTFALTSDNCRLVSVFGAALGMLYGALYQTDPLLMGVAGGSVSMATSAVSWLALRVLPSPTRSTTI